MFYLVIIRFEYSIEFIVAKELSKDLILGWNGFIKPFNGIINALAGTLQLDRPKPQNNVAFIKETITIAPFTEAMVSTRDRYSPFCQAIPLMNGNAIFENTIGLSLGLF